MTTKCIEKLYQNSGNLPLLGLLPESGRRLLDCGCGAGDNARILKAQGWSVTGITISPSEQLVASVHCDKVYLADLEQGIPKSIDDYFDCVLMSHILEHLVHPENLLRDAKAVLAPNGMIAVALPNVLVYYNRLRFLFGRFEYTDGGIMDETHVRFYTFAAGAELLEANGYKLVKVQSEGRFPLWKARNILPVRLVKALNHFVVKHWPGIFGWQSLYLARVAG
jgi:2-polyprenyl-3-methyl-5-hydroxy-6-metoxy-1,4-benzoquinol methylase